MPRFFIDAMLAAGVARVWECEVLVRIEGVFWFVFVAAAIAGAERWRAKPS